MARADRSPFEPVLYARYATPAESAAPSLNLFTAKFCRFFFSIIVCCFRVIDNGTAGRFECLTHTAERKSHRREGLSGARCTDALIER